MPDELRPSDDPLEEIRRLRAAGVPDELLAPAARKALTIKPPCPTCGGHTRLETTGGMRRCVDCGQEVQEDA